MEIPDTRVKKHHEVLIETTKSEEEPHRHLGKAFAEFCDDYENLELILLIASLYNDIRKTLLERLSPFIHNLKNSTGRRIRHRQLEEQDR